MKSVSSLSNHQSVALQDTTATMGDATHNCPISSYPVSTHLMQSKDRLASAYRGGSEKRSGCLELQDPCRSHFQRHVELD